MGPNATGCLTRATQAAGENGAVMLGGIAAKAALYRACRVASGAFLSQTNRLSLQYAATLAPIDWKPAGSPTSVGTGLSVARRRSGTRSPWRSASAAAVSSP